MASCYFQSIVSTSCRSGVIGVGNCRLAVEQELDRTSIDSQHQHRNGKISLEKAWDYQQPTSKGKCKAGHNAGLCYQFFSDSLCHMFPGLRGDILFLP